MKKSKTEATNISRRTVLYRAAILGAAAPILGSVIGSTPARAAQQTQEAVKYQAKPKDKQNCANCKSFKAPDACETVAGKVAPNGWCSIWITKA